MVCSLTLRHVPENRYVKKPLAQSSWRYESIVLTNRIAGKRMNIKKIKLFAFTPLFYFFQVNYLFCVMNENTENHRILQEL